MCDIRYPMMAWTALQYVLHTGCELGYIPAVYFHLTPMCGGDAAVNRPTSAINIYQWHSNTIKIFYQIESMLFLHVFWGQGPRGV
jgi:hypothetical protein